MGNFVQNNMEEDNKYIKRQRIYKTIMLVVLTAFITCIITAGYLSSKFNLSNGEETPISSLLTNMTDDSMTSQLKNIKNIIDKYYLYDYDEDEATDDAITGFVASLGDPYTEYIPADEMKEYTETITGNFVGIGIYMVKNTEKNLIQVLAPIKESPAEEAGILPGDFITKVDGVEYTGDDMTAASNNIKGEEGTKVNLEVLRGEETLNFEIERRKINTNPVIAEKLENNIGYLEVSSFDEDTADDFKEKFSRLKEQGITSLIIDLRDNGGGLVDEALDILDYIVPKGENLLITVDKNGKEEIDKAEEDEILVDMPVVVLVNNYSASASEIVAGALKDLGEATIVGTTTYGKGVIQSLMSLRNGSGLKVTIEEYYTPNRSKINEVGIEPDVEVEEDTSTEEDEQLQKAIDVLR